MLGPAALAGAVIVPLAFVTKSLDVDLEVVANRVSFTLDSTADGSPQIELLRSARANAITLFIDSVEIAADQIVDESTGNPLPLHVLRLRPRNRGWVEFKSADAPVLLNQFELSSGSAVQMTQEGSLLTVKVTPSERVHAEISATVPTLAVLQNCDILDADGTAVSALGDALQHRLRLSLSGPIVLNTEHPVDIRAELGGPGATQLGAWAEFFRVTHVAFPAGEGAAAMPIREAAITVAGADTRASTSHIHFITIPPEDTLEIATVGSQSGAIAVTASGKLSSLVAGPTPHSQVQLLPSVLDWMYHHQQVGLIAGILIWISGMVLSSVRLLADVGRIGPSAGAPAGTTWLARRP